MIISDGSSVRVDKQTDTPKHPERDTDNNTTYTLSLRKW